jgi:hypothetical protein
VGVVARAGVAAEDVAVDEEVAGALVLDVDAEAVFGGAGSLAS